MNAQDQVFGYRFDCLGPSAQNKFVFWIICHPQINHEIYVYRKQNAQGCFNQGMTRRFLQWSPIAVRHTNFILRDVFYDHLKTFEANIDLKDDHSNKCHIPWAVNVYKVFFIYVPFFWKLVTVITNNTVSARCNFVFHWYHIPQGLIPIATFK